MQLFYSQNINNDTIVLDKVETNHCINVLRYSCGDMINVVDGKGNLYLGVISSILQNECNVLIKEIKSLGLKDGISVDQPVPIPDDPFTNTIGRVGT